MSFKKKEWLDRCLWLLHFTGAFRFSWSLCKVCGPVARRWCAQFAALPVCCRSCRDLDFVCGTFLCFLLVFLSPAFSELLCRGRVWPECLALTHFAAHLIISASSNTPDCFHLSLVLPQVTFCSSSWLPLCHFQSQCNSKLQLHCHPTRPAFLTAASSQRSLCGSSVSRSPEPPSEPQLPVTMSTSYSTCWAYTAWAQAFIQCPSTWGTK